MNELTWVNPEMDRTDWPAGPWDDEPDKVAWTDAVTGMPCVAVRANPAYGNWCGYVAVGPGHPLHGKGYHEAGEHVDVHGGLSYADGCREDEPVEVAVCHVPEPGSPDDVWWLGFDCGHAFDLQPAWVARDPAVRDMAIRFRYEYRDVAYVRTQCEALASQLAALAD